MRRGRPPVLWCVVVLVFGAGVAAPVLAGGPWRVRGDGTPMRWPGASVTYYVDQGPLGALDNSAATALVQAAFAEWQAGGPLTFTLGGTLPADVGTPGYLDYWNQSHPMFPIVVIFDSDGSIIDDMFGSGSGADILGVARIDTPLALTATIAAASLVVNGRMIDGIVPDATELGVQGVFAHEIGHVLNLGHSALNHDLASDGDPANDRYIPTMYPLLTEDEEAIATLNPDDRAALLALYGSPTLSISGSTLSGGLPFQGAQVVARRTDDPLMEAYSFVSGAAYFPCSPGWVCPAPCPCDPCTTACAPLPPAGVYGLTVLSPGTYEVCVEQIFTGFTDASGTLVGPLAVPPVLPGPEDCFNSGESALPAGDDPVVADAIPVAGPVSAIDIELNEMPGSDPNEPNADPATASQLTPPLDVRYATLVDGDVDYFAIEVGEGDRLQVDVDAEELGYPHADLLLALFDDGGEPLMFHGEPWIVDDAVDPDTGQSTLDPAVDYVIDFVCSTTPCTATLAVSCYPDAGLSGCATASPVPYWIRVEVRGDLDGDGTFDPHDVCPGDVYNDLDQDGLCIGADNCPTVGTPTSMADDDADMILDECDNCRGLPNPDQADRDVDFVGDVCDNCPDVANPGQGTADGDGDGIPDECDLCPAVFDPPQLDADGDGAGNLCDNCPTVANPGQVDSDSNGTGDACEDTSRPEVTGTLPLDWQIDVAPDTDILIFMSKAVDPATVDEISVVLEAGSLKTDGDVELSDGSVITFDPATSLSPDTVYTIRVRSPLADVWGNPVVPFQATFETLGSSGGINTGEIGSGVTGGSATGSGSTGFSVASLGDVNSDGYDDYAYASPGSNSGRGSITLAFGGPGLFSGGTLIGIELIGEIGQSVGQTVADIGDIDNDGVADFAFSAPEPPGGSSSKVYVVFGNDSGDPAFPTPPTSINLDSGTLTDCTDGDAFRGALFVIPKAEMAGFSIAGAGDVNGDLIDDFLIGAPGASPAGRVGAGKVYLVYGQPGGVGLECETIALADVGSTVPGLVFHGETAGDEAGRAVSLWANPDTGTDDLLIGAPGAVTSSRSGAPIGPATGYLYAILGGTTNLTPGPVPPMWVMELSRVAGGGAFEIQGVVFLGTTVDGEIGRSTTGAVDLDGDGIPDVIYAGNGTVYIVPGEGPKNVSSSSESNPRNSLDPGGAKISRGIGSGNAFNDFGAMLFTEGNEQLGPLVVAPGGDLNADGIDDLIIGAPQANSGDGRIYVLFGRRIRWDPVTPLAEIGVTVPGLQIDIGQGQEIGDQLGAAIAGGSDLDGDGVDDLILGAPAGSGAVYALSLASPGEVTGLTISGATASTLSWNPAPRSSTHNVYRGSLLTLRSQGGVRTSDMVEPAGGGCGLTGDVLITTDPLLAPGAGYVFLVTGESRFGEGPLGPPGLGRQNDLACP